MFIIPRPFSVLTTFTSVGERLMRPPSLFELSVVKLSEKTANSCRQCGCKCVFILGHYLKQLWGLKCQIFAKQEVCILQDYILNSINRSKIYFHQLIPLLIPNRMTCFFFRCFDWILVSIPEGTTPPSPENSPEGTLGQWPWLPSETVKKPY